MVAKLGWIDQFRTHRSSRLELPSRPEGDRANLNLGHRTASLGVRYEVNWQLNGYQRHEAMFYLLLLTIQLCGAIIFIWHALPEFREVVINPGQQLPKGLHSDVWMVGVFCAMQTSFWIRQHYVPIPFRRRNKLLSHMFLFLGRISFIFGSAMFSVVVFRHLPEMGPQTDMLLTAWRGLIFVACLFALFCTSLEVERLGQAFENREQQVNCGSFW